MDMMYSNTIHNIHNMLSILINETILLGQKHVAVEGKKPPNDIYLKKVNPPNTTVNILKVMF